MPFVPYNSLSPSQKLAARTRPVTQPARPDSAYIDSLRLDRSAPEATYAHFAFWVRPDGNLAPYGMIVLPLLEVRDGHAFQRDPAHPIGRNYNYSDNIRKHRVNVAPPCMAA